MSGDDEVTVMNESEGLDAARQYSARRSERVPVLRIVLAVAVGAICALLRLRSHPAQAVPALLLGSGACALFFGGVTLVRRLRAGRDARLLVAEVPELSRALVPGTKEPRGYRQ